MVTWLNTTFTSFDYNILKFFHELALKHRTVLTPIAHFLSTIGNIPLLLIGWIGILLFVIKKDKKCGLMIIFSIIIGSIITTIIIKTIVYRPRPYDSGVLDYKIWWEMFGLENDWDTSFPSGHVCAATAGVSGYYFWKKKKIVLLAYLYPLLMSCSRMYFCVHYPSDCIAGFIVGLSSALLCIPFVRALYKLFEKYPDHFLSRYCLTGSFKKQAGL